MSSPQQINRLGNTNYSLKKSKSLSFITDIEALSSALEKFHYENENLNRSPRHSESSIEISYVNDTSKSATCSEASFEGEAQQVDDSGIDERSQRYNDQLKCLEVKFDAIGDRLLEHAEVLSKFKQQLDVYNETLRKIVAEQNGGIACFHSTNDPKEQSSQSTDQPETADGLKNGDAINLRAQALLDALEPKKRNATIDLFIKDAITELLQSEDLKTQIVSSTTAAVKDMVTSCVSRDLAKTYMPVLQKSHRQLCYQVNRSLNETLKEIEAKAAMYSRSTHSSTKAVRFSLDRHRRLLENTALMYVDYLKTVRNSVQSILDKEIQEWHDNMVKEMSKHLTKKQEETSPLKYIPNSPPQPAVPGKSAISQLMSSIEIKEQMNNGDVNGSFEKALLALNLSLVMAACKAIDPDLVFGPPCRLEQHVLLSLLQQLSTDMVHDTQIKCRYLEEAITNLDVKNIYTRTHLPTVVTEICMNLSGFLAAYPGHMCIRRIRMIMMAAKSFV